MRHVEQKTSIINISGLGLKPKHLLTNIRV